MKCTSTNTRQCRSKMTSQSIISVPEDLTDPDELRRVILIILEQLDSAAGIETGLREQVEELAERVETLERQLSELTEPEIELADVFGVVTVINAQSS